VTIANSGGGASTVELVLDYVQLADLELLENGGYAPLAGFMSQHDCESVLANQTLSSGDPWDVPILLEVSDEIADAVSTGASLTLVHPESVRLAVIEDASVWESDGSSVAAGKYVSGAVRGLVAPVHYDFSELRLSPEEYRSKNSDGSSSNVIGFSSVAPISASELDAVVSAARDANARVLLAPVISPDLGWSRWHFDLVRSYVAVLPRFDDVPVDIVVIPAAHGDEVAGGSRLRSTVLRNYGCARVIEPEQGGETIDDSLPEISKIMETSNPPSSVRGFTVFFTGLPSSGKSTLANHLVGKLMEEGSRSVTLLDGDIVRRHLSSELGFSREDRDTNIRRIGYVASEITKAGGIAVCAPIAPYDGVRREVRDLVSEYGDFIEVYVSTPVEVCEQRDRKGLYAKARQGLLKGFTGVDDPYEVPTRAELEIDTSDIETDESVMKLMELLGGLGLVETS
jgi:sulfate adenylyltransferase